MAKFKKDDMGSFDGLLHDKLNTEEAPQAASKPAQVEKVSETPNEKKVPKEVKKRGRPKTNRETKKRITFTLLQSNYDEASKVAYIEGKSVSEVIGDYLLEYTSQNRDKIIEYNNLTEK